MFRPMTRKVKLSVIVSALSSMFSNKRGNSPLRAKVQMLCQQNYAEILSAYLSAM